MVESVWVDCLTTQPDESTPLEPFHLIPTRLQARYHQVRHASILSYRVWISLCSKMTHFEYHWGMNRGQLDLQTPLNIVHRE